MLFLCEVYEFMKPEVSVIIPAYNCEKTIEKAIASALNQDNVTVELVIVDDCSEDDTPKIIDKIAEKNRQIRVLHNSENKGVSETRNIGCKQANRKYIAFLDSDDFWEPNKLEKQIHLMEHKQAGMSYTAYYIVKDDNRIESKLYQVPTYVTYNKLLKENVIGCSTVVIRTELMRNCSFNSEYFHEDYVLWLQLLRKGEIAVGVQEPLVYYKTGGRSSDKVKAMYNRFIVYRKAEKISFFKSIYYMLCYMWNGIIKYIDM